MTEHEQRQPSRPSPPTRQPYSPRPALFWLMVLLVFLLSACLVVSWAVFLGLGGRPAAPAHGPAVALISVEGLIQASSGGWGGGGGMVDVLDQIRQAQKDKGVKAVVLWLDSPGGAPAASQAVYQAVLKLREKKPVVAAMGDVAASGAYYIASAATKIVASPATETGSIGVIFTTINLSALLQRYGIQPATIKSGPYKDTGSPFRPMRPDEEALLRDLIKDIYEQFVRDVAAGRNMSPDEMRKLADGRVYTGRQAKRLGLIDELGSRDDAIRLAAELGGIKGWPRIKQYRAVPRWLRSLLAAVPHRPWYAALLERPGAWLTLPIPGAGLKVFTYPGP